MSVADAAVRRGRAELLRAPLLTAAVGAAGLALLHVRDPHTQGSYGFCPYLLLTGVPCPGCGGLRAVNLLTNGEWAAAISSNLVAVLLVAGAIIAWVVWFARRAAGRDVRMLPAGYVVPLVVLIALVVFGAFRLTPWGAWLQP